MADSKEKPIVHVLYPRRWDVDYWAEKNEQGLEPDRYQYGFNRLEKYGFKITFCRFPRWKILQKVDSICSRLFKLTFDPYYFIFQLKHFLTADVIINPLDYEGLTLCWLRKYNLFGLQKKKHIFVAVWLPGLVQTCTKSQLQRFKELLATVDICMYYCENAKNILKTHLNIPEYKFEKIHFGVDKDFYTEQHVPENNFILVPGSDSYRDFEILSEIGKALPDETLYLASHIKIKKSTPPSNVHYLNLKYNRELLDYYRKAKLLLIPIKKDCPTSCGSSVLMESMLLEKTVVVTSTEYMKETVHNGKTAILAEPNSAQSIIDTIKTLNQNHALRKMIGKNARVYALTHFTSEHCMQKMAESINNLLLSEKTHKKTIHILYPAHWSVDKWTEDYEKGAVPDKYQYGFNRLEKYGYNITYARFLQSFTMKKFSNLTKRIFQYSFNPYYFIYQIKHFRKADVFISPLDPEGLMFCWLRKYKILNLHRKIHIYIPAWLSSWTQDTAEHQLKILRSLIATVDVLMYFGESDKRIYKEYLLVPDEKLKKLNFGVDADFYQPYHTHTNRYIIVPGNDVYRDFEILAEVAVELPSETFLIITPRKLTLKRNPPNLTIRSASHKELVDLYLKAKLVIIPLKKGCLTASGVTVLNESLLLNKTIIVTSSDLMKELTTGWDDYVTFVKPGCKESLKETILNHHSVKPRIELTSEQKYSLSTEYSMEKLSQIIGQLLNINNPRDF